MLDRRLDKLSNMLQLFVTGKDRSLGHARRIETWLTGGSKTEAACRHFETGFSLAHAWQILHGPIPAGERLLPKKPFILGGQYDIKNLHSVEAAKGMRFRAEIARQLRDAPDGSTVRLKLTDI